MQVPAIRSPTPAVLLMAAAVISCGCSGKTIELLPEAGGLDAGTDGNPFAVSDGGLVLCGGHVCACSNGLDDDGDGHIDGLDEECIAPFDDDESTFGTGLPGDNRDPQCQDCFFDGNSGSGDDGCRYATECLTGAAAPTSGPCPTCEVTARCRDNCLSRTPNGCDCFGCCTVMLPDGSSVDVALGGSCSLMRAADETVCPRCTPNPDCLNDCGHCELCPGRTELPPDCTPEEACAAGVASCIDGSSCPAGTFCQLGCCVELLI